MKDLLVVIGEANEHVGPYAIDLASRLGAHVAGTAIYPDTPFDTFACARINYDLVCTARERATVDARSAALGFDRLAAAAGVSSESVSLCSSTYTLANEVVLLSRSFDLVAIEQPAGDPATALDDCLEALLLRSHRPCLVVPFIQRGPARMDRIVIAWDGSRSAARALADALPVLRRARRVEIVTVFRSPALPSANLDVVDHLRRHGIAARRRSLVSELAVSDAILADLDDTEADLLVMGAYGQSPVRELILGGATRGVLRSMTLPVLLSH